MLDASATNAETVAARTAINYLAGSPPASLSEALEWAATDKFNVLAYGAVADGSTDISTALQEAIDDAASTGGVVWLPKQGSKYKLTGTVELASNVHLMSNGAIIDTDGNTNSAVITATGATNIRIVGLRIEGTGSNGAAGGVTLISLDGCSNVHIDNNDIEMTPTEDDVNSSAIRISDDPAATTDATNDYYDIWITNNIIKPSSLGILAQSRLSNDCEMRRLYIIGNTIDYANIDADSLVSDVPAGIKVDLNVRDIVIANNTLYGRTYATHGINVQEDIYNCVITGNVIKEFDTEGIIIEAGQTSAVVQNVLISNNVITNMVGATSHAIRVKNTGDAGTADNWRNILVQGNIVHNCAGFGIYEDSSNDSGGTDRILGYVIENNIVAVTGDSAIYVRSHRTHIAGNAIRQSAAVTGIQLVGGGSAPNYVSIINNRVTTTGSTLTGGNSTNIIRNNILNDVWTPGNETTTMIRRWNSGDYWMLEGVVSALSLPVTVQTSFSLIAISEVGGPARGAYSCIGEITSGSSAAGTFFATFAAHFRMTDASTVDSQTGGWVYRSNTTIFSAVDLHTNLTNIILRVTNGSGTVSLDNLMIHFTIFKTDDL